MIMLLQEAGELLILSKLIFIIPHRYTAYDMKHKTFTLTGLTASLQCGKKKHFSFLMYVQMIDLNQYENNSQSLLCYESNLATDP